MKTKLRAAFFVAITALLFSSCGLAHAVNSAFVSVSDADFYRQLELTDERISALQNAAAQQRAHRADQNRRRWPHIAQPIKDSSEAKTDL